MSPRRHALLFLLASSIAACSGGPGGGSPNSGNGGGNGGGGGGGNGGPPPVEVPTSILTVQERIDLADLDPLFAEDADFAAVAGGLSLFAAGEVEDDAGRRVVWAEGTGAGGEILSAVRHCDAGGCVAALQAIPSSGLSWTLASGAAAAPGPIGRPVLLKDLEGHELKNKTTLSAALSTWQAALLLDPDHLPSVDLHARRFVALSTFGEVFGVGLEAASDAAKAHGGFDELTETAYVREADVEAMLRDLDGTDAAVWLTQGVREEAQSGWKSARTVGFTVNRGGYGETLMSRDQLQTAAKENVAGGPGLLVLAASQSYSDGSEAQPDLGSAWTKLVASWPPGEQGGRILVGVVGSADVGPILTATATFLDAFLGGDSTLQEALDLGSAVLAPHGASLATNRSDTGRRWLRRFDDLWAGAPFVPSKAKITTYITGSQLCGEPGGDKTPPIPPLPDASPFSEIVFDGAAFEGDNVFDFEGGSFDIDIHYRGVLTGLEVDDRILLELWGNLSEEYQGFHAFGEGRIRELSTDPDTGVLTVLFDGDVHAAPFLDALGRECILGTPVFSKKTSEKAVLTLTP